MKKVLAIAQKGIVLSQDGHKILVSKYLTSKYLPAKLVDKFCLPGGQITFGEQPDDSFVNEVRQETGITIAPQLPFATWTWIYQKENQLKQIVAIARLARHKSGQIQPPPQEKETTIAKARWMRLEEVKENLANFVADEQRVVQKFLEFQTKNPLASQDNVEVTRQTYKQIYRSYTQSNATIPESVKKMLDKFVSLVSSAKVLDIGCANGRESKHLSDHGLKVTGCDNVEEFIDLAKENCPKCSFLLADMRTLNLPDSSFAGLWASASFLHIPKIDAPLTLRNFHRLLKPHGILYLSVMEGNFDGLRENPQMKWPQRHFSDYQSPELEKLLIEAKFQILHSEKVIAPWGPTFLHYFCQKN